MRTLKRRLLHGGAWAFGGKVATALSVLVANALLARLLSPRDLGVYFLAYSVLSLGALLGTLGLTRVVVRFVAENLSLGRPGQIRRVVGMVFALGALGATGVGLTYLLFGHVLANYLFHAPALAAVSGLVAGWMSVTVFQLLLAETFRGFHDIRLASIFEGLATWVLLILCLVSMWILVGQATVASVVLLSAGSGLASAILAGLLLWHKLGSLPKKGEAKSRIRVAGMLDVAYPLLAADLAVYAFARSDVWIVGALLPQEDVAVYGAAVRLMTLVVMPMWIVNSVTPPLIAEINVQGKTEELERMVRSAATFAGVLASPALLGLILWGGPILGLVYGDYYRAGWIVLVILSVGYCVNIWSGACGITLMMTGHQKIFMGVSLACSIATIIAGLAMVNHYGTVGMAIVVSLSLIIQNIAVWLIAKRKVGIWTHFSLNELLVFARTIRARYL